MCPEQQGKSCLINRVCTPVVGNVEVVLELVVVVVVAAIPGIAGRRGGLAKVPLVT